PSTSTSSKSSPTSSAEPLAPPAPPDNSAIISGGPGYDDYTEPAKNSKGFSIPKIPKWPWWLPFPRWPKGNKKPSPPENLFAIGYFQQCTPHEEFFDIIEDCTAGAAVFKGHDGDNDACNNKPLFRGKDEKVAHNPGYPEKIIFEGGGRKNCEYDRSENAASGILVCDGVKAECTKLEPDPFKVDCIKKGSVPESWHKQIHCVFPVPSPPASTPPTPEFVVGYFDWCDERSCGSEAAVFAPFGDDDFACAEKPIYRNAKPGPHDGPKLPRLLNGMAEGEKAANFG
ncbi:MAG: hypothetical protein L6R42_010898, partial [Xanthoria sp. 1 TBL-2021]